MTPAFSTVLHGTSAAGHPPVLPPQTLPASVVSAAAGKPKRYSTQRQKTQPEAGDAVYMPPEPAMVEQEQRTVMPANAATQVAAAVSNVPHGLPPRLQRNKYMGWCFCFIIQEYGFEINS